MTEHRCTNCEGVDSATCFFADTDGDRTEIAHLNAVYAREDVGRGEWTATDYFAQSVCKTVGCGSPVLGRWTTWGYRFICNPLQLQLWRLDDRKAAKR